MKLPDTPRVVCIADPAFGGRGYPYAFGCVPRTLERAGMTVHHLDIGTGTFESFKNEIERFRPDVIFGFVQTLPSLQKLCSFLERYHPVPATNWSLEDPNGVTGKNGAFTMLDASAHFDLWFCNDARMVPFWRTRAAFMPPGFDDEVFFDRRQPRHYDLSYIGHLGPPDTSRMYWPYMKEMGRYGRKALMGLDRPMGLPLLPRFLEKLLRSKRLRKPLQRLPIWSCDWKNPKDEQEKAAFINQSKIHVGLNRVRGFWEADLLRLIPDYPLDRHGFFYQLKGRLFHGIGTGTMVLNEHCPEFDDMFEVGREIITFEYGDVDDFRDKLAWYIRHDSERERVAEAGYRRGLKQHTWLARVKQIFAHIRKAL